MKNHNLLFISIATFSIMIAFVGIIYSIDYFSRGYHNIDLTYNFIKDWEKEITLVDTGADGITRPLVHYYINGLRQIHIALYSSMAFSFLLGMILMLIISDYGIHQ